MEAPLGGARRSLSDPSPAWDPAAPGVLVLTSGRLVRGPDLRRLAALAVLDGVPAGQAVADTRRHCSPRAVETPSQRRWVERFPTV